MNYTFTTLDTVLVKLNTELKNFNFDEYEAIEWAGEAMDSLKAPEIQEQVGNSKFIEGLLDTSLSEEQCRIETDYGTYHCGYDTYYKNLIKDIQTLSL